MLESCAPFQNLSITLTLKRQMVGRISNINISNIVYDILRKLVHVVVLPSKSIYKIEA